MTLLLDVLFLSALSLSGFYFIFLVLITYRKLYRYPISDAVDEYVGISILKPLKGLDDQLEQNLESFFTLDYPEYEIVFGVRDSDDPVISMVKKLQKKFPAIRSELVINNARIGLNPKINNLNNILPSAHYPYLVISDSNVRVNRDYLKNLMSIMQLPNTGMVTSAIRGINARTTGSIFENLHINAFITPSIFAIKRLINLPISIGKSMLFHRDILEKIGSFKAFRDILAEDHLIGLAIRNLGLEIRNCPDTIDNVNEKWAIKSFINRHLRWAKLRKTINPLYYMIEVLSNPIPIAMIYALIRFDSVGLNILLMTIFLKIVIDFSITIMLRSELRWLHYAVIPVKDIIIGCIWLIPHFSRKVIWRGNAFRISKNSRLIPITKG